MIYFLILALLIVIAGFIFIFRQIKSLGLKQSGDQSPLLIQVQLKEIRETLDHKLSESHRAMQTQFGQTTQIVKDVTERLTKLDETNKQVINFTDQLQNLQDILKNPKQRGILGEYFLETLLKNVLPPGSYQMQYPFKDGTIVDAVVFVKDKVIPIDSKFSLENYNRLVEERNDAERARLEKSFVTDLKSRIQETAKYIQPSQGTMDFAFMFIPHEAIYYDLIVNKIGALKDEDTENLIQRAASKYKVIIVSPTSFLAYLQTVLQGLRALQIEESAKEIRERVEQLGKHILAYDEYFKKLGNNLGTTVNSYNAAYKELNKIDKDVVKITDGENKIEPLQIDKPNN
ncbi:MAG: DNA recombination protein RmuC [Candidatus Parcubacteria bacterium]|nr:DNA recombination protein RmuC [Candidatus Parcubacteria bacterium]